MDNHITKYGYPDKSAWQNAGKVRNSVRTLPASSTSRPSRSGHMQVMRGVGDAAPYKRLSSSAVFQVFRTRLLIYKLTQMDNHINLFYKISAKNVFFTDIANYTSLPRNI